MFTESGFSYDGEVPVSEISNSDIPNSFASNFNVPIYSQPGSMQQPGFTQQPMFAQQPQFGEYVNNQFPQMTQEQIKIQIASLAVEYGVPGRKGVDVRFVVGPKERNKPPGKGTGEVDKFKRQWRNLLDFSRSHNWRMLLDTGFQGNYRDEAMTFIIDRQEWKTVVHYMIGMLYVNIPQYSVLYSLESRKIEHGFWGDAKLAIEEHIRNIRSGQYDIDYDYPQKVEGYLKRALLAKFTQNPIARQALLLTEDAIISRRGGESETGILDMPVFAEVRAMIAKEPAMIYEGDSVPTKKEEIEQQRAENSEELNLGYMNSENQETISIDSGDRLVAGSVLQSSLCQPVSLASQRDSLNSLGVTNFKVDTEPIMDTECIVYLTTGCKHVDFVNLLNLYGQPKFVRRNIYGIERMGDDAKNGIMIGVQRGATSFEAEYVVFDVVLGAEKQEYLVEKKSSRRTIITSIKGAGGRGKRIISKKLEDEKPSVTAKVQVAPIEVILYLQPFSTGFGVFIVAASLDVRILDFMRFITGVKFSPAVQIHVPKEQEAPTAGQPASFQAPSQPSFQAISQHAQQNTGFNLNLNSPLDPNTVFFYFSGSSDSPAPGKGTNEKISPGREQEFQPLSTAVGWRKMLSNFFVSPFILDGLTWNTVEHYYQGSKFKRNNPEFYKLFSLNSQSNICQDPVIAKSAGGKSGVSKGTVLRPANIQADPDFFSGRGHFEMFNAIFAKFSQSDYLKGVLLATGNAVLTHGTRGVETKPVYELMKVRELLRGNAQ